jgi:hypothetical protein
MKNSIFFFGLALMATMLFSSCEAIAGIFEAGMGVGIFIVVFIIIVIVVLVMRSRRGP